MTTPHKLTIYGSLAALAVAVSILLAQGCASAAPEEPGPPLATVEYVDRLLAEHAEGHLSQADLDEALAGLQKIQARILDELLRLSEQQSELAAALARLTECVERPAECGLEVE